LDRIEITPARTFKGEINPPPDKSISHRAVIFSALSKGKSRVRNFLRAKDTESTVNVFRTLGIEIEDEEDGLHISGKGIRGLVEPLDVIDCGNSGTTIRLVSGVLSGNPFFSVLTGDDSLRLRPMARIIRPLGLMGAQILARSDNKYPPLGIRGTKLKPIVYDLPVASAQVKSCLLLAGLYADGQTVVSEPFRSRDHSERMLPAFGADLNVDGLRVIVKGGTELHPLDTEVPGDFSSAAFFLVASLIVKESEITIRNVGINPTRTGLLGVLEQMGAVIRLENIHTVSGETVADIYSQGKVGLEPFHVSGEIVPSLIDEFPVLCVAAAFANGTSTIRGAEELRVKESDRISSISEELRKMGVGIEEFPDGLSIKGVERLKGTEVRSHGDHRIAMSLSVAALAAEGKTTINGASAVDISFPGFFDILRRFAS
jgi:3-phosphoshikimate 1-carboxyvinyltransferase